MGKVKYIENNDYLICRKRITKLIRHLIKAYYMDSFCYERFKKIMNNEIGVATELEAKFKRYLDAYTYLLMNVSSDLTKDVFDTFYYIMEHKEIASYISEDIVSKFYEPSKLSPLEKSINIHKYVRTHIKTDNEFLKVAIGVFILNYSLLKNGYPSIVFTSREYKNYNELIENKSDKEILEYFMKKINEAPRNTKKYYQELKPITLKEVINVINDDKEVIDKVYYVTKILVFGSLSTKEMRYDSDIDIYVKFKEDLTYEEKEQLLDNLKRYLSVKLHRITDVHELPYLMTTLDQIEAFKHTFLIYEGGKTNE